MLAANTSPRNSRIIPLSRLELTVRHGYAHTILKESFFPFHPVSFFLSFIQVNNEHFVKLLKSSLVIILFSSSNHRINRPSPSTFSPWPSRTRPCDLTEPSHCHESRHRRSTLTASQPLNPFTDSLIINRPLPQSLRNLNHRVTHLLYPSQHQRHTWASTPDHALSPNPAIAQIPTVNIVYTLP
jgi:hypothetical protein